MPPIQHLLLTLLAGQAHDTILAGIALADPATGRIRWHVAGVPGLFPNAATWERGRGWALDLGIRYAAYSAGDPLLGEIGKYTISQVLTELDAIADTGPGP